MKTCLKDNMPATAWGDGDRREQNDGSPQDIPVMMGRIREAFEVFDSQSLLLKRAYNRLRVQLASTNRKLREQNEVLSVKVRELKEMSDRLRCILESLTDGVLVVDRTLNIERCNRAAEMLFSNTRSRIEGKKYQDVTNGLGNAEKMMSAMTKGEPFLDDERTVGTGPGRTIVLASVAPIFSVEGEIIGAVEVLRDVTRMKMLEAKVEVHKRMSLLGQMSASVAHEIRNPLGTIEGFARLLKRDLADMPDHLRLASKIVEGAQNLNYVITNLLEYSRPAFIENVEFDALKLAVEVKDMLSAKAEQAGVILDAQGEQVLLPGDVRQLRQTLLNLALNAIEACPNGGRVTLLVERRERVCSISVLDNGTGIKPEDMPRLFDPFFTNKPAGTGLGLALCHKIVSAHGGEIKVSGKEGEGTKFEVLLNVSGDKP